MFEKFLFKRFPFTLKRRANIFFAAIFIFTVISIGIVLENKKKQKNKDTCNCRLLNPIVGVEMTKLISDILFAKT